MEPWKDEEGDELLFSPSTENPGRVRLHTSRDVGVYVRAADWPAITRKAHEALGLPSPVILERPEVGPMGVQPRSVSAWPSKNGDGVSIAIGGNMDTLAPDDAEGFAAAVAVLAERARAATPDPAEVEELAHAIRIGLFPGSDRVGLGVGESDREAARAALRWMNAKAARDAR